MPENDPAQTAARMSEALARQLAVVRQQVEPGLIAVAKEQPERLQAMYADIAAPIQEGFNAALRALAGYVTFHAEPDGSNAEVEVKPAEPGSLPPGWEAQLTRIILTSAEVGAVVEADATSYEIGQHLLAALAETYYRDPHEIESKIAERLDSDRDARALVRAGLVWIIEHVERVAAQDDTAALAYVQWLQAHLPAD